MPPTHVHNGVGGGVGEKKKVERVVIVMSLGRVHGLHQKLCAGLYVVGSKVRAVDVRVPSIVTTCNKTTTTENNTPL